MQVVLREGESFESLLKRFRAGVARDGIISEYKRHKAFISKSEKARAKARRAERKRMLKALKAARRSAA